MKEIRKHLKQLVSSLTKEQLEKLALVTVEELYQMDVIHFDMDRKRPYWEATGDDLI